MNKSLWKTLTLSLGAVSLLVTVGCGSSKPQPTTVNLPPPRPVAAPATQTTPPPVARMETAPTPASAPGPTAAASNNPVSAGPAPTMSVETGLYRCEFGARVTIKRIAPDRSSLVLNWKGKDLTMRAVTSQSGALRFEEASSGLVWMAIIGKSQLLDSKKGQRLANECNL